MPQRAKSMCKKPGCPALLDKPGYCEAHINLASLRSLDKKKTPEQKSFYSSYAWTLASKQHRAREPLCRQCKSEGIVSKGELVHHNPPLDELKARGLNPLDDKYLETLCFNCHQKELRAKRR